MWLKSANNAKALILGTLLASDGFVTVKDSKGWLFPVVYPYRCTLTKFVSWIVTQREIVEVTSRTGDIFTISRGVEAVPANDTTAITQTTTAFAFSDNDSFQLTRPTSKDTEVDTELARLETDKLNKSWWTLTWLLQWAKSTNIASATTTNLATATGNFAHITWTTTITGFWTVTAWTQITLVFDWILILTHNAVSLILPTGANITTAVGDSMIIESEWTWKWKCVSFLRANWSALLVSAVPILLWWDWTDWILSISSWTTTLPFVSWNIWYLEKDYSSINISWTAILNFSNLISSWNIAYIKCKWDFTMTGWTLWMSWLWANWWTWWGASDQWIIWTSWKLWNYPVFTSLSNAWAGGIRWFSWSWWAGWALINKYLNNHFNSSLSLFNWAGWGWWGRGWDIAVKYGGDWWTGGWILIIEVWGNFTFTWWTILMSWSVWQNWLWSPSWSSAWSGGGWGWAGWMVYILWKTLQANTWTINVNWGDGWVGQWNSNWFTPATWWGGWWTIASWWAGWGTTAVTEPWKTWTAWSSNSYWTWWSGGLWWAWGNSRSGGGWGGWGWAGYKYLYFIN